jgi:hypothetical protein
MYDNRQRCCVCKKVGEADGEDMTSQRQAVKRFRVSDAGRNGCARSRH